jgi:hypothetical protein
MIARADYLMRSHVIWAQVEAIAAALLAQRTLTSSKIREACREVIRDGRRKQALEAEWIAREGANSEVLMEEIAVE